jgi:hypothetical protein
LTRFDAVWPDVFRRAVSALVHRGTRRAAAEDAVQEAGTRAVASDVPFADAEDLLRWIHTVAWRLVLDARKRDRRLVYEVPDEPSVEDVSRAVEQRLRLQHLRVLLGTLTPDERSALIEGAPAADRRTATRLAVRRHRLRSKLLAMLDGAAALVGLLRRFDAPHRARRTTLVAAPLLIVMTALTTASLRHDSPTTAPAIERIDLPSLGTQPQAAPSARGLTVSERAARSAPASPPVNLPKVQVPYARPGGNGRVYGRPKQPDDHFVCLALNGVPPRCADLPVRITG